MNREKQAIRSLMASTGHSYQQARALHLLQTRYSVKSEAGMLPNPAVVLSWADAFAHLGELRVQYTDRGLGPSIVLADYDAEVWEAVYDEPYTGSSREEEQAYNARAKAQRGLESLFSDSSFLRVATPLRRFSTHREGRSNEDWLLHAGAAVRYGAKRFTEEEYEAARAVCAHPRALEWIPVEGFATEMRRTTIDPLDLLAPCMPHSWLPLLDELLDAHLLISEPDTALILPTPAHRLVISSGPGKYGAGLFEPFESAVRIHVRAFTTDRPGHARLYKEWVLPVSEPEKLARSIERFAASIS